MADIFDLIKTIFDKGGIGIAIFLITLSIIFNIYAAYNLDFLKKFGTREKKECGNEYLEVETPNYQIYKVIAPPNTTYSSYMYNSFKFIQGAYITIFIAFSVNLFIDLYKIGMDSSLPQQIRILTVIVAILMASGISSYLATVYAPYITPMFQNFKTADIIIKKPDTSRLLALYLTPMAFLLPLGFIGYVVYTHAANSPITFDKSYLTFIIVYFIIITVSIKFNSTSLDVIGSINSTYESTIADIQTNIKRILNDDPKASPNPATTAPIMPPSTSADKLKVFLIKNIKAIENVDGDNFILQDYSDNLWKYLIHQNGNELSDIYSATSDAKTQNAITNIRTGMRKLRNDKSIPKTLTTFTNTTLQFAIIIFSLIFFAVFHFIYKYRNQPVSASVFISSLAISLVILGPMYGWIMKVASKNY